MLDNRRDPRVPIIDEVCGSNNYEMISRHRLVSLSHQLGVQTTIYT